MQAVCANVDFTKPPNLEALPFHDEEVWGPNAHVAVSQKYMMQPRLAKKHAKFRPSTRKVILFSLSLLPPLLPIGLARRPRLPRLPRLVDVSGDWEGRVSLPCTGLASPWWSNTGTLQLFLNWISWQSIIMYAIYGNIYHQCTPNVSIYIYHTWILWVTVYHEICETYFNSANCRKLKH